MKTPERLILWHVKLLFNGKPNGRLCVVSQPDNTQGTVEARIATYYQSIVKDSTKVTAKAKRAVNRKIILRV